VKTAVRKDAVGWVKEKYATEMDACTGLKENERFQKLYHNKTLKYHAKE
jgi:hypothetical protein